MPRTFANAVGKRARSPRGARRIYEPVGDRNGDCCFSDPARSRNGDEAAFRTLFRYFGDMVGAPENPGYDKRKCRAAHSAGPQHPGPADKCGRASSRPHLRWPGPRTRHGQSRALCNSKTAASRLVSSSNTATTSRIVYVLERSPRAAFIGNSVALNRVIGPSQCLDRPCTAARFFQRWPSCAPKTIGWHRPSQALTQFRRWQRTVEPVGAPTRAPLVARSLDQTRSLGEPLRKPHLSSLPLARFGATHRPMPEVRRHNRRHIYRARSRRPAPHRPTGTRTARAPEARAAPHARPRARFPSRYRDRSRGRR